MINLREDDPCHRTRCRKGGKDMRKWKAFLSLMLVFLFISSSAFATSSSSKYIKVRMDGKTISVLVAPIMVDGKLVYTDDPSFISGNTTYVPMRFISDQFGGKIEWNESTNTATVTVDKVDNWQ